MHANGFYDRSRIPKEVWQYAKKNGLKPFALMTKESGWTEDTLDVSIVIFSEHLPRTGELMMMDGDLYMVVNITHFVDDAPKNGGNYLFTTVMVKKVEPGSG